MKKKKSTRATQSRKSKKEAGSYQAIVDTPKGSRNKYKFDEQTQRFKLGSVLTAGAVFPYDFGYLPGTHAGDGDPLDVLILLEEPTFAGCEIEVRIIGAIEAEQIEAGKTMRNDRLIAVAVASHNFAGVHQLSEIGEPVIEQIEHFFISYNQMKGKAFVPTARADAARAKALIRQGKKNFSTKQQKTKSRNRKGSSA